MKLRLSNLVVLLAVLALVGCRRQVATHVEKRENRLSKTTDVDVAAWLKLSRPELVKIIDEWTTTLENDRQAVRHSHDATDLLPRLCPPVRFPVFQEAVYSSDAGFSLPPYLKPGKTDAAVALHLARFGDCEAALKLVPPADEQLKKQVEELRYEKNYPIEWSRLVGLVLSESQLKLAGGDIPAASRLVLVHKQLRDLLDARAAKGPLGEVLLSSGRRALSLAAKAWHEPARKMEPLAEDVDAALVEWGSTTGPMPALRPGATWETIAATVAQPLKGKVICIRKREELARALDLMAYPIPTDALTALTVFLDKQDRLAEIQFTYRSKIEDVYPGPAHLAYHLEEHGATPKSRSVEASLYQQSYVAGGLSFEAWRTNRSNALGGWVRVRDADKPLKSMRAHDLRVVGPIDLERGFEANRLALSPGRPGPSVILTEGAALKKLGEGLSLPVPAGAVMRRESAHDLLAEVRLSWPAEQAARALEGLLPALWSAFGNAEMSAAEETKGAFLAFTWKDDRTQAQLVLPFDDKEAILTIRDRRSKDSLVQREADARKREESERKARLAAGKPDVRLPRSPGTVNDFSLEGLKLGQSKSEAEAVLPTGKSCRRKDFADGVSVVVLSEPLRGSAYWARQIVLRYAEDKLSEVRLRYQEVGGTRHKGESLLEQLSAGKAGAPEPIPPSWNGLWTGVPRPGKLVAVRWQDDLTIRTYQRDAGGSEVILTDRTVDPGKSQGPLAFVTAGVKGCRVGDAKEVVHAALKQPVALSGGADVHRQPANSPYEMILVWYAGGKVSRLVAVYRLRPGTKEEDVTAALGKAWGQDAAGLGALRRQEGERGRVLGSYFWHDDLTRVEAFVQNDDQGPRLMMEWRNWTQGQTATASAAVVESGR
jgi:hypothetical protein